MAFVLDAAIAVVWVFASGAALTAAGFDPDTVQLATLYLRWMVLYIFPSHAFVMFSNYLQTLNSVRAVLVVNAVSAGVNIGLNAALVFGPHGLRFQGSPIATALTTWCTLIGIVAYMRWSGVAAHSWTVWDREAFSPVRIATMVKQALPAALGNFVEDFHLVIMSFLAAKLDAASIAAHNAFMNTFATATCIFYGSTKATIIRIGYHLGRRAVRSAKLVAVIHFCVTGVLGATVAALFLSLRQEVGHMFSSDPEVISLASQISVPVGAAYAALTLFFVGMGVLQGQGRPGFVAVAFLVGAWGVAVPSAFVFYHQGRGLLGIWLALIAGYATVTVIAVTAAAVSDWHKAADAAVARSRKLQEDGMPHDGKEALLSRDGGASASTSSGRSSSINGDSAIAASVTNPGDDGMEPLMGGGDVP